jgi:hypothetical protein
MLPDNLQHGSETYHNRRGVPQIQAGWAGKRKRLPYPGCVFGSVFRVLSVAVWRCPWVLGRGFGADGEFCGFGLAHIDWIYCTISADSRHNRRNSNNLPFSKAAASNEMHPLKMRLFDRLAFSLCACVAKRSSGTGRKSNELSRRKLTRWNEASLESKPHVVLS